MPIENITLLEVPMDAPVDKIMNIAEEKLLLTNTEEGLLILTDLVGSTPFNVATQLKSKQNHCIIVSGLNLPMLLKISNYRTLNLEELAKKAVVGGQSAISSHE